MPLDQQSIILISEAVQQMLMPLEISTSSIFDVPCHCNKCGWKGKVLDCEPDVDGDGSLGCPECNSVVVCEQEPSEIIKALLSVLPDSIDEHACWDWCWNELTDSAQEQVKKVRQSAVAWLKEHNA